MRKKSRWKNRNGYCDFNMKTLALEGLQRNHVSCLQNVVIIAGDTLRIKLQPELFIELPLRAFKGTTFQELEKCSVVRNKLTFTCM